MVSIQDLALIHRQLTGQQVADHIPAIPRHLPLWKNPLLVQRIFNDQQSRPQLQDHLNMSPWSWIGPLSEDLKGNADLVPGMALKSETMSTPANGEECGICKSMLINFELWTIIRICVTWTSILSPARVALCVVKLPSVRICNGTWPNSVHELYKSKHKYYIITRRAKVTFLRRTTIS